eukprot:gnl/MRDRNA2_/MRDRNA2_30718_c0_seq1.p1 gnl/MRDRNA2_/MRDRNA2_30718_c0~~gnl/MRDRNA2_/MRDRNA2_30718_c0_seq1.p1  ORF type:complete len:425 (+),score=78.37 gnl/MRDRNA2_/MRDRNA2_30718_c0_seq1:685-1959(+)
MKMIVHKLTFWCGPDARWNILDFLLVGLTLVDSFIVQGDSANVSVYRLFRLFRLARLVRLFAIFKQLWLFVVGIAQAMSIIGWGLLLTFLVTYIAAIFVTRQLDDLSENDELIFHYFGTLFRSMFTLFQMSTGDGWASMVARPVIEKRSEMAVFFLLFVCVTQMAFLNVIVAVIVESVLKQALKSDNDLLKEAEEKLKTVMHNIYDVFVTLDKDNDGRLTKQEFVSGLNVQDVKVQLQRADISLQDAEDMFDILDYDGSGTLSLEEFVEGCLKGRGPARAKDLLAVHCDVSRCQDRLQKIEGSLSKVVADQQALVERFDAMHRKSTVDALLKNTISDTHQIHVDTHQSFESGKESKGTESPRSIVSGNFQADPAADLSKMVESFHRLLGDDGELWNRLNKLEMMLRSKAFDTPRGIFEIGEQLC